MRILRTLAALAAAALLTLSASAQDGDVDIEEAMSSVVMIYGDDGFGSGFAVGENCLVTNAHVIAVLDDKVNIRCSDGSQHEGYLIDADYEKDLALIGIDDLTFQPLIIKNSEQVKIGSDVYALGSPKGMSFSATKGILSRREELGSFDSRIQSDAIIYGGNSGGPLIDSTGCVIGVNSDNVNGTPGISFAIPSETVKDYIQAVGLKQDENGNVIERMTATEHAIDLPTREQPETPDAPSAPAPATFISLGASELALGAAILAALAIIGIVILILILRRTNERIKLLTYQLEQKNSSIKDNKN